MQSDQQPQNKEELSQEEQRILREEKELEKLDSLNLASEKEQKHNEYNLLIDSAAGKLDKTHLNPEINKLSKSKAPVDMYCNKSDVVVCRDKNITYSVILNQVNIATQNNKFYVIQVLKSTVEEEENNYFLFTRWGRAGYEGQNSLKGPISADEAISGYNNKLRDKTGTNGYSKLEINYDEDVTEETN